MHVLFFSDCSGLRNQELLFVAYSLACTSKGHKVSYATQKYFANHLPKLVVFYPLILETLTVLTFLLRLVQCDSERLRTLPLVLCYSFNHW